MGDDDDEICGKGAQRTRIHAIYSSSFSPPQTTHQTLSYESLIRTCHANAERRRREQANDYRVFAFPVLCLLCLSFRVDPISRNPGDWSIGEDVDWSIGEDVPSSNLGVAYYIP